MQLGPALAIGATVGGAALSAMGQIMAGREQARASQFEADQLRVQELQTRTAAAQMESRRLDELASSLETIAAITSGRGVGLASPSFRAISENRLEGEERRIQTEKTNMLTRADLQRREADMAQRKGKMSLLAGYLGAGAGLASSAVTLSRLPRATSTILTSSSTDPRRIGSLY